MHKLIHFVVVVVAYELNVSVVMRYKISDQNMHSICVIYYKFSELFVKFDL